MFFRQVLHEDLGCASYVVADGGQAVVIDPKWDVEDYLRLAEEHGFAIAHVLETHNHADHVSGKGRLAKATGATIHVPAAAGVDFPHEPLGRRGRGAGRGGRDHRARDAGPPARAHRLPDRGREPWRGALARRHGRLALRRRCRPARSRGRQGGGRARPVRLGKAPPRSRRLRGGVARAYRRLALRRRRHEREAGHDDRVRAPLQPAAGERGRGGLRAGAHRQPGPPAAELPAHRGLEPRASAHGRPVRGGAAPGRRAGALGRGRDADRRAGHGRVRRRPRRRARST